MSSSVIRPSDESVCGVRCRNSGAGVWDCS
jgi:hypothetical protein